MDVNHILHPLVKRGSPIRQTGRDGDDEQVRLAEQLAYCENIPLEAAHSIISRHPAARTGGWDERP